MKQKTAGRVFAIFLILFSPACAMVGGGTVGTGLPDSPAHHRVTHPITLYGTVVQADGTPLRNAKIRIVADRATESAVTDDAGQFELLVRSYPGEVISISLPEHAAVGRFMANDRDRMMLNIYLSADRALEIRVPVIGK